MTERNAWPRETTRRSPFPPSSTRGARCPSTPPRARREPTCARARRSRSPPAAAPPCPPALRLQIPPGHVGLVWPRSGLAVRHGIDTLAGVIDSDYRGEVRVVLVNHGDEPFRIAPGDRVAQLLVQRVERAAFTAAAEIDDTDRGEGGFGSTGR